MRDKEADMLLWEALQSKAPRTTTPQPTGTPVKASTRLPYDRQCAAMKKSGQRCRGKTLRGSEYCMFHDPATAAKRRQSMNSPKAIQRRRLSQIPGGYLRKLSNRTAVGHAMDRLYREVRTGLVTPEMGQVLFSILTRLADRELANGSKPNGRARAEVLRPKIKEALTRAERAAWRRAVANAPADLLERQKALPTRVERVERVETSRALPETASPRLALPGGGTTPASA